MTTTIGYGSPNKASTHSVHGSALGSKEVEATRKNLSWAHEPFHVPDEVKRYSVVLVKLKKQSITVLANKLFCYPEIQTCSCSLGSSSGCCMHHTILNMVFSFPLYIHSKWYIQILWYSGCFEETVLTR